MKSLWRPFQMRWDQHRRAQDYEFSSYSGDIPLFSLAHGRSIEVTSGSPGSHHTYNIMQYGASMVCWCVRGCFNLIVDYTFPSPIVSDIVSLRYIHVTILMSIYCTTMQPLWSSFHGMSQSKPDLWPMIKINGFQIANNIMRRFNQLIGLLLLLLFFFFFLDLMHVIIIIILL